MNNGLEGEIEDKKSALFFINQSNRTGDEKYKNNPSSLTNDPTPRSSSRHFYLSAYNPFFIDLLLPMKHHKLDFLLVLD